MFLVFSLGATHDFESNNILGGQLREAIELGMHPLSNILCQYKAFLKGKLGS